MYGKAKAADLWNQYDLSIPVDLKRLVAELRLEVVFFPFRGRIKEMVVGRVIGVQPGLPRPWFRWYVAHAIGHHTLHVGTSFYLESWQWASNSKAERQAEEFAAWLLGGPNGYRLSARDLGVPYEKSLMLQSAAGKSRLGGSRGSPQIGLPITGD